MAEREKVIILKKAERHVLHWKGLLLFLAILIGSSACGKNETESHSFIDSLGEPISLEGEELKIGDPKVGDSTETSEEKDTAGEQPTELSQTMALPILNPDGETLETRIHVPEGYERTTADEGSLTAFLREFPMKPDGAKVHLYDGSEKNTQNDHVAVFDLPLENYDLQQCADSVMRIYAEYYWATQQYDKIKFHFTNGFLAEYGKWRDGNRISVNGNNVSWIKQKSKDTSYECFVRYLRTVFCYAGTLSMERESQPTTLSAIKPGDVFLYGASPGHVVMIVDVCENEMGQKAFLLAQGYMPAQEFHLLKNNDHPEDPWYYESEVTYPFQTPEYLFQEGSLRKLDY